MCPRRVAAACLIGVTIVSAGGLSNCTYGNCNIHITPGCLEGAQKDNPRHLDLWCPGDAGYECYKIPTLLRVPNSTTLLGFIEARKHSCDDKGYIDLLLRRSFDNGKTWTTPSLVYGNSTEKEWVTIGDALPVYDRHTGHIHLVFTRNNEDVFLSHSTDLGASWTPPTNITAVAVLTRGKPKGYVGTGHAGGLQLATGRLLVPLYGGGRPGSFVLGSDDAGVSWQVIGELNTGNEWAMAPLEPGGPRLIGSLRDTSTVGGRRLQSFSADGGVTWSKARKVWDLPEPITGCEGAVILHPNGKLYYSHPDRPVLRNVMEIKVSEDGGKSWKHHTTIWGKGAGCDPPCVAAASYSSMVVLGEDDDSQIALFYMRNNRTMIIFEGRGSSFTTFAP